MDEINSNPRRRTALWIWFVVLGTLLLLAALLFNASKNNNVQSSEINASIEQFSHLTSGQADLAELSDAQIADEKAIESNVEVNNIAVVSKENSSIDNVKSVQAYQESDKIIPVIADKEDGNAIESDLISESKARPESSSTQLANSKLENYNRNMLSDLSVLPTAALEALGVEKRQLNPAMAFSNPIEPQVRQNNFALGVFLGASVWNFKLNQNYNTALDPADFRHDLGKSTHFGLELNYELSGKVNLFAQLGLEHVVFHSGHNSSLTYDSAHEINNTPYNYYDLVMASPVGFMNSSISVQRNTQENLPATDIVVDLNSTHKITNIDLGIGASVNILQSDLVNLNVDLMGGINNFSAVRNTLENFRVNHSALQSYEGMINEAQDRIDDTTPYAGFGIRALRHVNRDYTISLSAMYKTNLEPIYVQDDFSTTIDRFQTTLVLAKKF